MGLIREFKEFAVKGSVLDVAIGIIIGASFGNVVNSLVKDVIMPPIGLLLGKVDFINLFVSLNGVHYETLAAAQSKPIPPAPTTKDCPYCKENIPLAAVRCPHCTSDLKA